jgi:hypothetical protein
MRVVNSTLSTAAALMDELLLAWQRACCTDCMGCIMCSDYTTAVAASSSVLHGKLPSPPVRRLKLGDYSIFIPMTIVHAAAHLFKLHLCCELL